MHNALAATATPPPSPSASEPSASVLDVLQTPFPSANEAGVRDATLLAAFHEILTTLARATNGPVSLDGDKTEASGEPAEDTPRVTKSVLTLVARKACLLTSCASATVALLDDTREIIEFAAAWGDDANDLAGSRVRASDTLAGNTARTGEPYWAFRPEVEADDKGGSLSFVHSAAVVPIFLNGQPVGAVAALHKTNRLPFDGADLMTLSTLAASASVVIGSQAVRAERAQHKRELDVLYEAVRNVSGALSAPDVLRVVVEQVAGQMESSAVVVWLVSDDRTHLNIAEDEGLTPDEREIVLPAAAQPASSAGWVSALLRQTRPVFLRFVGGEGEDKLPSSTGRGDFWTCESPFPALTARSGLACPIRSGDTVRGFVMVLSVQAPGVYQAPDAKLLAALASQAAVALENADLYEDATRREREAAALYDLSQTVTASLPLPDVMRSVAETVLRLLAVDTFVLFLHDPPTDKLRIHSERNAPPGLRDQYAPLVGQGVPGWVMEFETPASVPDVTRDPRNSSAPLNTEGIASLIAAPLQIGSATIGVLCAMTFQPRAFTVAEMELAYTIANQAALAIENARIRETVRQNESQNRKFFSRLARALNAAHDPNDAPRQIVSQALDVMEADRCALWAVRAEDNALEKTAHLGFRTQSDGVEQSIFSANASTPAGWIARNNHVLVIENVNTDDRFAHSYDKPAQGTVAAYLGVPVRLGGRVVGVLELFTRRRRKWKAEEERLLLSFATQVAAAFQNARQAQTALRASARAACLERLHSLAADQKNASIRIDAVVSLLALHLNAPVIVLRQSGQHKPWEIGTASLALDALPQESMQALFAFLGTPRADTFTTNKDFFLASRQAENAGRGAAVAVFQAGENGNDLQPLLQAAVELLTIENEPETTRTRRTSKEVKGK